jgi:hypothetical protein
MSGTNSIPLAIAHGETVLERVLLAIIEAHPTALTSGSAQERLDVAMATLLGKSQEHSAAIGKALTFMTRERQRDICKIARKSPDPRRSRFSAEPHQGRSL